MNTSPRSNQESAQDQAFELSLTEGPSRRAHEHALGLQDNAYPWDSLDPTRYPALLVERARRSWTETALSEYEVLAALGQLLTAFTQARVPLDFTSQAARFAAQEVRHVELCARVAMQLGGGAPLRFSPDKIVVHLDPQLTSLQQSNELVVRVLCVGEALSLPLLRLSMQSASHPLTKAVLTQIVRDEAAHAQLGWDYLDWCELKAEECTRLAAAARDAIERHAPGWERLQSRTENGVTSEGFRLADINALGWAESAAYAECARRTLSEQIVPKLATYGIHV